MTHWLLKSIFTHLHVFVYFLLQLVSSSILLWSCKMQEIISVVCTCFLAQNVMYLGARSLYFWEETRLGSHCLLLIHFYNYRVSCEFQRSHTALSPTILVPNGSLTLLTQAVAWRQLLTHSLLLEAFNPVGNFMWLNFVMHWLRSLMFSRKWRQMKQMRFL
jgi:hypothetical protein